MPNPSPSPSRFSERKTEESQAALYRSFGDAEGSLHWSAPEASQELAGGAPDSTSKVWGDFSPTARG